MMCGVYLRVGERVHMTNMRQRLTYSLVGAENIILKRNGIVGKILLVVGKYLLFRENIMYFGK